MAKHEARPSLLVFSDDWGRHPSSCQHLVSHLLDDYQVWWVNTIGMRPPTVDLATVKRIVEKARHWTASKSNPSANEDVTPEPNVLNPRMWPWFRRRHDRWLNRRLLTRQLNKAIATMPKPVIAVTTIPVVADIMDTLDVNSWVYYCVDDFGQWPGLDQAAMESMERDVIRKAEVWVAAGEVLKHRLLEQAANPALLTHGVDLEHWQQSPNFQRGAESPRSSVGPRATFWGLVDRRLDMEIVRAINSSFPGQLSFVGPQDHPDPQLHSLDRVVFEPPVPYTELPRIADASDVLVMPYADLPVTRAMQPLKLLEYLATGKPVVARGLPATQPWRDCMDISDHPSEFAELVRLRAVEGIPQDQQVARQRLVDEDWQAKAAEFERLILASLERGR